MGVVVVGQGNGGQPGLGPLTELLESQFLTQDSASIPPESVENQIRFLLLSQAWES